MPAPHSDVSTHQRIRTQDLTPLLASRQLSRAANIQGWPLSPFYHPWRGHPGKDRLQHLRWCTDMWRGSSFHALLVVLLALQVLVPPAWMQHGLECALRCRLAATTGVHCPLRYTAQQANPRQHCPEQASAPSPAELRCHCSHCSPSPSTLDGTRFVLPQVVPVTSLSVTLLQRRT